MQTAPEQTDLGLHSLLFCPQLEKTCLWSLQAGNNIVYLQKLARVFSWLTAWLIDWLTVLFFTIMVIPIAIILLPGQTKTSWADEDLLSSLPARRECPLTNFNKRCAWGLNSQLQDGSQTTNGLRASGKMFLRSRYSNCIWYCSFLAADYKGTGWLIRLHQWPGWSASLLFALIHRFSHDFAHMEKPDCSNFFRVSKFFEFLQYRKTPENSDARKICGNYPKIWTMRLCHIE